MPFFSIIIPSYNRGHILSETINSIIEQSHDDFEIILVDDGSTDNTKEIIEVLMKSENRLKYVYQNNSERSIARNNGIKNACGQYICFLDSDDLFEKTHLENLYNSILDKSSPIALFFTDQKILEDISSTFKELPLSYHGEEVRSYFLKSSIVPGRICIHNEILKTEQFDPKINIVEDTDLWFRISCKFPVYYLPERTLIYRWHDDNSVNIKNNAFLTRLNGLKITFSKVESNDVSMKLKREILSNCYFGIHRFHVNKKNVFRARFEMLKSIFLYPESRLKEKIYLVLFPEKAI
jgi:glycosyltransferase involved in cell wall biosynthesis